MRMEAQALRDRQVESSRQQVELEAELQQLREELVRQVTQGQVTLQVDVELWSQVCSDLTQTMTHGVFGVVGA